MVHCDFGAVGAELLEASAQRAETIPNYPPYDIEVTGEDAYRISIAVAGFAADDLNLEEREGVLSVAGERRDEGHEISAWWMVGAFVGVSAAVVSLLSWVPGGS